MLKGNRVKNQRGLFNQLSNHNYEAIDMMSKSTPHKRDVIDIKTELEVVENPELLIYCDKNDCGWCYASPDIDSNDINGACMKPKDCPYRNSLVQQVLGIPHGNS